MLDYYILPSFPLPHSQLRTLKHFYFFPPHTYSLHSQVFSWDNLVLTRIFLFYLNSSYFAFISHSPGEFIITCKLFMSLGSFHKIIYFFLYLFLLCYFYLFKQSLNMYFLYTENVDNIVSDFLHIFITFPFNRTDKEYLG